MGDNVKHINNENNRKGTDMKREELKELILTYGTFNNWKGYVGLYLTSKRLRFLKKYVPQYDTMSLKEIYEAL